MIRPGRPSQPAGPALPDLQMPPKMKKVDTPPRRVNQKKTSTKAHWPQPRTNTKWSKVAARRDYQKLMLCTKKHNRNHGYGHLRLGGLSPGESLR